MDNNADAARRGNGHKGARGLEEAGANDGNGHNTNLRAGSGVWRDANVRNNLNFIVGA